MKTPEEETYCKPSKTEILYTVNATSVNYFYLLAKTFHEVCENFTFTNFYAA
jgi:hypothetical protein